MGYPLHKNLMMKIVLNVHTSFIIKGTSIEINSIAKSIHQNLEIRNRKKGGREKNPSDISLGLMFSILMMFINWIRKVYHKVRFSVVNHQLQFELNRLMSRYRRLQMSMFERPLARYNLSSTYELPAIQQKLTI